MALFQPVKATSQPTESTQNIYLLYSEYIRTWIENGRQFLSLKYKLVRNRIIHLQIKKLYLFKFRCNLRQLIKLVMFLFP